MIDTRSLNKVGDLLNSEGPILALYTGNGSLFLSSYLKDGSGEVFYSTKQSALRQYLNSEITLEELYILSPDFLVVQKFRKEESTFLKEDFKSQIQCGGDYFSNVQSGMRNDVLAEEYSR